jgi:hypothetical protein
VHLRRTLAGLSSLAVVSAASLVLVPQASAAPSTAAPTAPATRLVDAALAAPETGDELDMPDSYPYQPTLRRFPQPAYDAADSADLIGYDDLAPTLMDWMRTSNRISTQVVGQSTQGRDILLVTVTEPETAEETARQAAWKRLIREDPAAAAEDAGLLAGYKTPIWMSSNIHGNEWEGTDASMKYIEDLIEAPWRQVASVLRNNRLYFTLTVNPDGRTIGTRATALSLDANRDMITNTTPEARAYVQTVHALQPLYTADIHGYTGVLQVEPCGPPHGENYEYDLFLPHAYAAALKVEQDVVAAEIPGNTYYNTTTGQVVPANTGPETAHIRIPYRDVPSGWDDYPPIFTAQYAAYFGSIANTVELPLRRAGANGTQSPGNAVINTAVARQTITSIIEYVDANSTAMLEDQIEVFRRGAAGEPKVQLTEANIAQVPGPDQWKQHWDVADNQDPVVLPRAYVIPVGPRQRSASDAADVVDALLFHDIEVRTLDAALTVGGRTYPSGSYIVDMHQPLRGLANSLLSLGTDISQKVPTMYDISAWSYSYLWGATVDRFGLTTDGAPAVSSTPVNAAVSNADVPAEGSYLTFELAGVSDFQALNSLLDEGVAVSVLDDGSAIVGADSETYDAIGVVAQLFDIDVDVATKAEVAQLGREDTHGLDDLTVAYTGTQDDRLSLLELGFDDIEPVTAAGINADPTVLEDVDVLWIGGSLTFDSTQTAGSNAVAAYVASGRGIVGRGTAANDVLNTFGVLSSTAVSGNRDGNGIVAVDTPTTSVLAPYAQDYAFIYPAISFDVGPGTTVEQRYDEGNPLLAGHWVGTNATDGPEYAGGRPSVIAGENAGGARGLVFGTSVFFRTHPRGGMSQAARALLWAAPDVAGVQAPVDTTTSLTVRDADIRYPHDVEISVVVDADADVPVGTVQVLRAGAVLRSVRLTEADQGEADITLSRLAPGRYRLRARFVPAGGTLFRQSTSAPATVLVRKAASATRLWVNEDRAAQGLRAPARITVRAPGVVPVGTVLVTDRGEVIRTLRFGRAVDGSRTVLLPALSNGAHRLRAVFRPTPLLTGSSSEVVAVFVRRG